MSVDRILSLVKDFSYSKCLSLTVLLQPQLQLQLQLRFFTLHYTTPHHTTLHYTRPHYTTLHCITLHSLHHQICNRNYTTLLTLHHNYNSTTLQLQLQLRYTTLHPAVVGEAHCNQTQLQPSFSPSVDLLCHVWFTTTNLSYGCPIFETSATVLCGTTGMVWYGMVWYGLVWFGLVCIHSVCVCICTHVSIIYLCTCETSPGTGMISLMLMWRGAVNNELQSTLLCRLCINMLWPKPSASNRGNHLGPSDASCQDVWNSNIQWQLCKPRPLPQPDLLIDRRKFRSQTSDNMNRWIAEMGSVRDEMRRRKKIKKEKVSEERRSRCAKR